MIHHSDGSSSVSPAEVRTIFRVIVPGGSDAVYRLDGVELTNPKDYRVDDLRIGGNSQLSKTSGEIPGEVFTSSSGQARFDLVSGGSTIDLELTHLGDESNGSPPDCAIRLTACLTA